MEQTFSQAGGKDKMKLLKHCDSYKKNTVFLGMLLMIPVLVISVVNYLLLFEKSVRTMRQSFELESEQKLELLDTNLSPMFRLTDLRRTDERFQTHYLETKHFSDAFYEITRALQQDTVWTAFFDSVSYYNREQDKVYTYSSQKTSGEYFGWEEGKTGNYPDITLEACQEGKELLMQPGSQIRAFRAGHVAEAGGIIFAVPLEMGEGNLPRSFMIFTVSDKVMSNLWETAKGVSYTIFYNDAPIYRSGEKETADNEGKDGDICRTASLKTFFTMDREYMFQCIMPEIVTQTGTTFFILIISLQMLLYYTRKNYEPIREILKRFPQTEPKRNTLTAEFQYINFMLEDLTSSQEALKQENRNMKMEKGLYYLFSREKLEEHKTAEKCLKAGINQNRKRYVCLLAEQSCPFSTLREMFEVEEDSAGNENDLYSMEVSETKTLYLLGSDWTEDELKRTLERLQTQNEVSVSEVVDGIINIPYAYRSISEVPKTPDEVRKKEYPVLELQFLDSAVKNENLEKAKFAVSILNGNMKTYSSIVKGTILASAANVFWGQEANEILGRLGNLEEQEVDRLVGEWMEKRLGKSGQPARKKALTRNMHTILKYIEEHGASPDFTIKAMASDFGTSASNLGHQFKKSTGQTLSAFIEEWKMQKAEEMLQKGETVSEVSKKLGYLSTPAFTEAFKKYAGITPSRYRNYGKQEEEVLPGKEEHAPSDTK